eukprot:CAMPEP_0180251722 /NCGR_PEP_ID=MMETSP0987-20121128/38592_1 /TAXON_ID=697907 /ORGANISM="non described non described, Strain CCMP2293" /LENGTH=207 /DNA_ID=CAMNT_0022220289 /DNA_START=13 /DNA_END=634 /DNA_ORIENTATION=+
MSTHTYANEVKLFHKWTYDDIEVSDDISLEVSPRAEQIPVPGRRQTAGPGSREEGSQVTEKRAGGKRSAGVGGQWQQLWLYLRGEDQEQRWTGAPLEARAVQQWPNCPHVGCLVDGEQLGGRCGGAVRRRAQFAAGVAMGGLSWLIAGVTLLAVIAARQRVVEAGLHAPEPGSSLRNLGGWLVLPRFSGIRSPVCQSMLVQCCGCVP